MPLCGILFNDKLIYKNLEIGAVKNGARPILESLTNPTSEGINVTSFQIWYISTPTRTFQFHLPEVGAVLHKLGKSKHNFGHSLFVDFLARGGTPIPGRLESAVWRNILVSFWFSPLETKIVLAASPCIKY